MQENVCPQCDKEVLPPLNRLVQDSCGHKKCRHCLLADEIKCKQCQIVNGNNNISTNIKAYGDHNFAPDPNKNVDVENNYSQSTLKTSNKSAHIENHTAVIQCNGKPKVALDKIHYVSRNDYVPIRNDLQNSADSIETTSENKELNSDLNALEIANDTKELNLNLEVKVPATDHNFKTPPIDFTRRVTRTTFSVSKELNLNFDKTKTSAMRPNLKNVKKIGVNFKTPLVAQNKEPGLQLDFKSTKKKKLIEVPEHISVFSNPSFFQCNSCNKRFKTKGHVKYHLFCTGEMKPPHQCTYCSKGFVLKTQLDIHLLKHSNEKPNTCHICQKSFYEASKLKRHLLVHSNERKLLCTECGKTYKNKEGLKIHLSTHKGEKLYDCNMCGAKFNNSSNLKRHLTTHSGGKSHMCDLCGKTFKLKWALLVHRKSHSRKRDFLCEICLKTFLLNKDLQRHILTHDLNGYTTYTCSVCSTTFRRRDNLHRHAKNSHPDKKAEVIVNKHEKLRLPAATKVTAERNPVVIDNPNAINVITAPPAFAKNIGNTAGSGKTSLSYVAVPRDESNVDIVDSRTTVSASATAEGYNGPPKLAFKGTAFKMHYNIKRDCDYIHPTQVPPPISMSESVDICQKIMSPSTNYTCPISPNINERTSTEIYQKILCADVSSDNQKKVCSIDSERVRQIGECGHKINPSIQTELGPNGTVLMIGEDTRVDGLSPLKEHEEPCKSPDREILVAQVPILNLSETVDICKRIMSPSTDYTDPTKNVDDLTFKRNCQRILSPPPDTLPDPKIFDASEKILVPGTIPLSESVNIYQKIMSPSTDFKDPSKSVDERAFKETCQKILSITVDSPGSDINLPAPSVGPLQEVSSPHFSNYSSPRSDLSQYSSPGVSPRPGLPQYSSSLHYSSSFQNQKHAVIKSIKFKVPREYTKTFKVQNQQPASVIVNNSNVTHKTS